MVSVGIRELRQRASELLRLVAEGETVQITDRGRPVALLTPVPRGNTLEELIAAGEVTPATRDFDDLPPPLPLEEGEELPSKILERLREDRL